MKNNKKSSLLTVFTRLSLRKKVNLVGLTVILLFAVILFLRVLPLLEQGKLEERRGKLKAVVNSVVSLMDFYERQIRSQAWKTDPTMPKNIAQAKKLIIKNLRQMRYDKTEYFFILDGRGKMVMHPLKPELEGKNMLDIKDHNGDAIFHSMVINSKRDSEAFVSFLWQAKYSPIIFEPQTTYAKYYWPWDWVVCSGVYTQDILDSMKEINYLSAGYIVLTSAVTIVLLFAFVYFNLSKPLGSLLRAIEEIKKDNLDHRVTAFFDDELGHISKQFNDMVKHRKATQEELYELNASLEDKVAQRTSELTDSLKIVKNLKVQQDGDYFLTSLLIKPLQSELNESKHITTESHIEQYKQFQFRKWKNELGGDICITDNITLNNKKYVFFVNADAMGKSVQGAGGVLLFGASVKAHLIQTKAGKAFAALPELWLKSLFLDLNQLFQTFDGSMLISAVFGLIDETTGVMYFINAEHPWPVLYRDETPTFLASEENIQKIGTPQSKDIDLYIQYFKLKAGDRVIMGSDGRDDILIKNEQGVEELNFNEKLFLDFVKKGDGDIKKIAHDIKEVGRLKDDLSLLSIAYQSNEAQIQSLSDPIEIDAYTTALNLYKKELYQESLQILRKNFNGKKFYPEVYELFKVLYQKQKDYLRLANLQIHYWQLFPDEIDVLKNITIALYKSKTFDLAADYGESYRLRNPHDIEIYIVLTKVYIRKGFYQVALRRLNEGLEIEPDNDEIIRLRPGIEKKMKKVKKVVHKPIKDVFHYQ